MAGGLAEVEVSADQAWLNDPRTRYPVTIDPGIVTDRPAGFDEFVQNTISVSDNQAENLLKLGYADDASCAAENATQKCRARSYLRFDGLAPYAGATLYSARLQLWEFHSWSCNPFGWYATRTDYVNGSVQWGSEPAWYDSGSVTTETKGYTSTCNDGWVSTDVAPVVDDSLANGWDSASMVIHAAGDSSRTGWTAISHDSWKKFDSNEGVNKPRLTVEYDHIPTVTNATVESDGSCGEGAAFRKYLTTTTPVFRARVNDDDVAPLPSFNVRFEVKAEPVGGGTVLSGLSGNGAPGGVLQASLSAPLDPSKIYRWQIRPMDLNGDGSVMGYGQWTAPCEIGYDSAAIVFPPIVEGIPTVLQDDDGDGVPETPYRVLDYGQPAELTFRAHPEDVGKIVGYRYGFSQERVAAANAPMVPAAADGSATAVVTNWELDGFGVPTGQIELHVRAVSITGANFSQFSDQEIFQQLTEVPPASHVPGDFHGDGLADLGGYRELSANEGVIYNLTGKPGGELSAPAHLIHVPYGAAASRVVQGDFNGDGRNDFASVVSDGGNDIVIRFLPSDGNGLTETEVWSSKLQDAGHWPLSGLRALAGDANADGRDDLIVAQGSGTSSWMLKVFVANPPGTTPFANPANWLSAPVMSDLNAVKLVAGRFDNSPGIDIAEFRDHGSCRTVLYLHEHVNGSALFAAGHSVWDSNSTGAFCWGLAQFTAGDYTGPGGLTGIVASYDLGDCKLAAYSFTPGTPWAAAVLQWDTASVVKRWCASRTELALRDTTGDGKADLLVTYRCCSAYVYQVWLMPSTGVVGPDVFGNPVQKWQGIVAPLGVTNVSSGNGLTDIGAYGPDRNTLYVTRNASTPGSPALGAGGPYSTGWSSVDKTMALDFDGDGKDDILGRNGDNLFIWRNTSTGTGWSIANYQNLGPGNSTVSSYLMGDFDGDGRVDVGAYGPDRNTLYLTRNASTPGNPALGAGGPYSTGWSSVDKTMTLDWDGDGKDDILGRVGDGLYIWRSTSTSTAFSFAGYQPIFAFGNSTVSYYLMGDFDGDGKPDIGALDTNHVNFYVNRNTSTPGNLSVVAGGLYSTGWGSRDNFMVTDWDGDGKDDILCRSGDSLLVFRSTSTATTWSFTQTNLGPGNVTVSSYLLIDSSR